MSTTEITTIDISGLRYGCTDAGRHAVEDWTEVWQGDDEENSFHEAFTFTDGAGREHVLIAKNFAVDSMWLPEYKTSFERWEFEEYTLLLRDNNDGELPPHALTEEEFAALFEEVEAHRHGSEGPMMNTWYECADVENEPEKAAAKLLRLPLCVVQVGGEWGLALTGGGMDLSWEIAEAYMTLGLYPPVWVADLPGMAGRGESEKDQRIIAACHRSLTVEINYLTRKRDQVVQRYGVESTGE